MSGGTFYWGEHRSAPNDIRAVHDSLSILRPAQTPERRRTSVRLRPPEDTYGTIALSFGQPKLDSFGVVTSREFQWHNHSRVRIFAHIEASRTAASSIGRPNRRDLPPPPGVEFAKSRQPAFPSCWS